MKKKGFIADYGLYIIMIFMIGLSLLLIYYIISQINTSFQTSNLPAVATDPLNLYKTKFVGIWDFFFLLLVIGFLLVLVIIGFTIRTHPAFAMIMFLIVIIFGIIAVYLANAWHDVATVPALSSIANEFTYLPYLMEKLPHIVIIFSVIFIVILFSKTSGDVNL